MIFLGTTLIIVSVLLLLFMAVAGLSRRRLSSVVFFAVACYAIIMAATAGDLIRQYGDELYLQASLIYGIGSIVLLMSVLFFSELVPGRRLSIPIWNQSDFQWHTNFATALALASIALIMIARENLMMNWNEARSSAGYLTVLSTMFFMLASPGIVSAFIPKKLTLGIMLLLLCVGLFVVMGSRASLLGALFFGMWLMLLRARDAGSRLRIVAIAVVATFVVHFFLRTLRGLGIAGLLQAFDEGNLLTTLLAVGGDVDVSGGEAAIPKYLMFAIKVSSIHDFGFMTSIQRLLLLPIPRIEGWINKPVDVTYLLWEKGFQQGLLDGAQGQQILLESYLTGSFGSLHPTLFGEYFLVGGWVSLVLSTVVLGAILVAIDLFMHRANRLTSLALCGPMLVGYMFVARGNSVIGLGYFFYLGVIVSLLCYVANRAKKLLQLKPNQALNQPEGGSQ